MRFKSLFPPGYNLVKDDPNLYLLHCVYYKELDQLFVIYKRYDNGEKVLDIIEEPEVPVFVSKINQKMNMEYIPINQADRFMLSYKNKKEEIKEELYDFKVVKYKDSKTGKLVQRKLFQEVPNRAEALHPNLFFYDVPIEQIVYAEYAINHYKQQGDLLYEDIPQPKIHFAAFDIETTYHRFDDPDKENYWSINTNTFVDGKDKVAYLDFVKDYDLYNRQKELVENKEKFIQEVKDTLMRSIDSSTLKPDVRERVQKICRNYVSDLKFIVRDFDSESELIRETTKTMFTTYKPDVLMAYNTTYDLGMFAKRIEELGLPKGTMNERGIGYDDILPPYYAPSNIGKNGDFKGETVTPKKRKVYLNNISHTLISDLQTCYYSARQGMVVSSYKLDTLATSVLGFGKYDYSHITNDILKLAQKDFWFHSIYALIDSIILLLINEVTREFESKLAYCMRSKCNIEETPQSNSTITRSFHTDAYTLVNNIPGNNINKVLKSMTLQDVKDCSRVNGVDYVPKWYAIRNREKFGGGIVSNANLYNYDKNLVKAYNVMNTEAILTEFRKVLDLVYLDFKSHYPSTLITRNISKSTLFGRIQYIKAKYDNKIILTSDKTQVGKPNYIYNLGRISLALANNDIISYGHMVFNLPSIDEMLDIVDPEDSPPIHSKPSIPVIEVKSPTKYSKLISLLSKLNRARYTLTDEQAMRKDTKHFMFTNGEFRYLGTLVGFEYKGSSLLDIAVSESGETYPQHDGDTTFYGITYKKNLISQNYNINIPRAKKFDIDGEFKLVPDSFYEDVMDCSFFTKKITLDDKVTILPSDVSIYYPFEYIMDEKKIKDGKKYPKVSPLRFKYDYLGETTKLEFRYEIEFLDINISIYQQMQIVNL